MNPLWQRMLKRNVQLNLLNAFMKSILRKKDRSAVRMTRQNGFFCMAALYGVENAPIRKRIASCRLRYVSQSLGGWHYLSWWFRKPIEEPDWLKVVDGRCFALSVVKVMNACDNLEVYPSIFITHNYMRQRTLNPDHKPLRIKANWLLNLIFKFKTNLFKFKP